MTGEKNPWKGLEQEFLDLLVLDTTWKASRSVSWLPPAEQPLSPQSVGPLNIPQDSSSVPGWGTGMHIQMWREQAQIPLWSIPQPLGGPYFPFPWEQGSLAPGTPIHSQRGATWVLLLIHLSYSWK